MTERTNINKTLGYRTYVDQQVDGTTRTIKHSIEDRGKKRKPFMGGGDR